MSQVSAANPRYATLNTQYAYEMFSMSAEEDGPIWMVNLMKYRPIADYVDGRESDISGRDADDLYAPIDVLTDIEAEIVFVGDVETQLLGDNPKWDRIAVVKYPTRRSFLEMSSRKDFQEKHVHKEAGMQTTIVMGCTPMNMPVYSKKDWAEILLHNRIRNINFCHIHFLPTFSVNSLYNIDYSSFHSLI